MRRAAHSKYKKLFSRSALILIATLPLSPARPQPRARAPARAPRSQRERGYTRAATQPMPYSLGSSPTSTLWAPPLPYGSSLAHFFPSPTAPHAESHVCTNARGSRRAAARRPALAPRSVTLASLAAGRAGRGRRRRRRDDAEEQPAAAEGDRGAPLGAGQDLRRDIGARPARAVRAVDDDRATDHLVCA